jgi:hypothetical protein
VISFTGDLAKAALAGQILASRWQATLPGRRCPTANTLGGFHQ